MSYLIYTPRPTKIGWVTLSSDQTVTSSQTSVAFDTITGSVNASIPSSGTLRLKSGYSYWIQAFVCVDRTSDLIVYECRWYSSGTELTEADGFFDSQLGEGNITESPVAQATINVGASDLDVSLVVGGSAGSVLADSTHLIIVEMNT
jgi:hypothetical protein